MANFKSFYKRNRIIKIEKKNCFKSSIYLHYVSILKEIHRSNIHKKELSLRHRKKNYSTTLFNALPIQLRSKFPMHKVKGKLSKSRLQTSDPHTRKNQHKVLNMQVLLLLKAGNINHAAFIP